MLAFYSLRKIIVNWSSHVVDEMVDERNAKRSETKSFNFINFLFFLIFKSKALTHFFRRRMGFAWLSACAAAALIVADKTKEPRKKKNHDKNHKRRNPKTRRKSDTHNPTET